MKKKKTLKKGFNINKILIFIAVIIACNISVLYVNADQSSAEIPVDVPDQNVTVDITNGVKEFTDAVECYMYAEASLLASTCSSTITGFVKGSWAGKVMVHQTMDNTRYFDNNGVRYSTSTSLKQGSLGKNNYQRTVFNPKDADAKVYKIVTNTANNGVPNFSNVNWQAYTQAEYEKEFGSVPGKLMYLVRKSTVEKIETFEKTADGGYHVVLQLNKVTSVQSYKKLLRSSAGAMATSYPKFSSVRVEAWIDKYGNFIKNIMDDKATITMGLEIVSVECTMVSHYEEIFHNIGGNVEQPFEIPFSA